MCFSSGATPRARRRADRLHSAGPIACTARYPVRRESELAPCDPNQRTPGRVQAWHRRLGAQQSLLAIQIEPTELTGRLGRSAVRPGRQHVPQVLSARLQLQGRGQLEVRIVCVRFEQHGAVVVDQADPVEPLGPHRSPAQAHRVAGEPHARRTVGPQLQRAGAAHRRAALKRRSFRPDPQRAQHGSHIALRNQARPGAWLNRIDVRQETPRTLQLENKPAPSTRSPEH